MSLTLKYSDPRGIDEPATLVSLGSNVRYGQLSVTLSAEVGDSAMSTIAIEDPGGIYNFAGLRAFDIRETSAPSNNSVIARTVIQDRIIGRSRERALMTGADRLWTVDLTDYNWHLSSRIHTDSDANRPIETAGDRVRWLLTRAAHINLYDYGNVAYPSAQMDATDYRGQRAADLLADCAVESGYNFWCDFNEAHGRPELFFLDPNGTSYTADIAVSNVYGDRDGVTVFEPSVDAEARRSPSRLAYGVYLAYANGAVYVRNDTVGLQFGTIDQAAPMSNVKTRDRALRVANKFLADNDEEDDRLAWEIIVARSQVNDVRHGQRMPVRFQHIPGYEDPVYVRIVKKTVIQDEALGDDYYRLALEAVNTGDAAAAATTEVISSGTLSVGSVIYGYAGRIYDLGNRTGLTPFSLTSGQYYRITYTIVDTYNSPINGYLSMVTPNIGLAEAGVDTQFSDFSDHLWDVVVGGNTTYFDFQGPNMTIQATAPLGPTVPGYTYTTPWVRYLGNADSAELWLHAVPSSGFYGGYMVVSITLEHLL